MGWNGSGQKGTTPVQPKAAAKKPSPVRGVVAGLLVVAISAVAYFMFFSGTEKPQKVEKERKQTTIKEVTPAAAPKVAEEPKPEKKSEPEKPKFSMRALRNLTPEQREQKYVEHLAETKIPEADTNRAFRTGLEQVMSWIFTTELGDPPPLLPEISDFDLVHFEEIMNLKNEEYKTDSENAIVAKRAVELVKKEMKDYVAKGGDPQKFLEFYHSELERAYQERETARQQVMEVFKTEPDIGMDYLEKVNQSLKEKGIKGVTIAERTLRRMGIITEGNTEK